MKILVIRGQNLASLAGEFEVSLQEPPLSTAGLFAITGATGAGKSTLLDAMCLALFDKMPRFGNGRGGTPIGRGDEDPKQRLSSMDVRSILRRGRAHAYAEVEYLGRDNLRYRARWSVRRARDRVDGVIQDQSMELLELASGKRLGHKKTEVLEAIESTLGLTYDQFRRSALLAQGDFAAFLRANHDERASLLEQMTGTELYSKLSKAAFLKNKAVQEALRLLEAELGHVKMLEPTERIQLEQRIAELGDAKRQADTTVRTLDAILHWFRHREELLRNEREAIEAEKNAQQAFLDVRPLQEELARVERAYRIKPLRDGARDAAAAYTHAIAHRDALAEKARAALQRRDEATQQHAVCKAGFDAAVTELEAARPVLEEAAKLDAAVDDNRRILVETARRATEAADALQKASKELRGVEGEIKSANLRVETLESLIREKSAREPLAQQWQRWDAELKRYAGVANQEKTAASLHGELNAKSEQAARRHEEAKTALQHAEVARKRAETALKTAEDAALREEMTEALRLERDRLNQRAPLLQDLVQIAEQAMACLQEEEEERTTEKTRRERAVESESAANKVDKKVGQLQAKLEEAEHARDQASAEQGLSELRAQLCEGEPCPLCGSKRHPYAKEGAQFAGLVSEYKKRVKELRAILDDTRMLFEKHRADAEGFTRQADDSAKRADRAQKKYEAFKKEWSKKADKLGLDALPNERGLRAVRKDNNLVQARLAELKIIEERAARLLEQVTKHRKITDTRRGEEAAAREALSATEKAVDRARQQLEKNAEQLTNARTEREKIEQTLAEPFVGYAETWRKSLAANPAKFLSDCANAVSEYTAWMTERTECIAKRAVLETRRESRTATESERRTTSEQREQERLVAQENVTSAITKRGALFAGKATAIVRAEYDNAIKTRRNALDKATSDAATRQQQAIEAEADARGAHDAANARADTAEQAENALIVALSAEGLDRETLEKLLEKDDAWVNSTRARITERNTAANQAIAVLAERVRAREKHDDTGAPTMTREEAESQHKATLAAQGEATQALADAQSRLRSDNDARALYATKAQALKARQDEAKRWKVLDDLIGHSDGKTFRKFAQSLTLDALLSHANEHLSELAPRYRLMRVPGQDLDLQIADQDMADEIRSVNSLSGGESFLASLALALGLSSLAAQNVRVETLFIDEGFGTLDPETLDTALAALETLQATGRQVGLISHVAGIAEQIGSEVRVERLGGGRSRVRIRDASAKNLPPVTTELAASEGKGRGRNRGPKKVEVEA